MKKAEALSIRRVQSGGIRKLEGVAMREVEDWS